MIPPSSISFRLRTVAVNLEYEEAGDRENVPISRFNL
jgi:hypothetical protein